jgi:acyl carrier protein
VTDTDATLQRCFVALFPDLPKDRIPDARVDTVPEWDSLASVTLVALLEEELGIEIDDLDLPELRSYAAVREYVLRANEQP